MRDHNGQALTYVYFEDEPGRRSPAKLLTKNEARRIAANIAKLPAFAVKRMRPAGVETDREVCRSHLAKRGGTDNDDRFSRKVCLAPDNPPTIHRQSTGAARALDRLNSVEAEPGPQRRDPVTLFPCVL